MEYGTEVARRFAAPGRAGPLCGKPGAVLVGEAEDRSLNCWVRFYVEPEGDRVRRVGFEVFGCPHTVAAASRVAESLEGAHCSALRAIDVRRVATELGVPVEKLGKLLRIEDAVSRCWSEWSRREAKGFTYGSVTD